MNYRTLFNQWFIISSRPHGTITQMEGIRAIATFMVFICHFAAQSQHWIPSNSFTFELIFYLRFIGKTGVDLFFILSGFLIYGMLISKDRDIKDYLIRRVIRIYPAFLSVFIIYLILAFIFPSESRIPKDIYDAAVYIVSCLLLLPGIFDIKPLFTVAWSLSFELFFYIITPVFIILLKMRSWGVKKRIILLLALSLLGFIFAFFNDTKIIRLLMFVSGMLIYEINKVGLKRKLNFGWGVLFLTFIITAMAKSLFDFDHFVITLLMFFGYGYFCLSMLAAKDKSLLSSEPMRWYGNISYSYYLIHGLTLKVLFMLVAFFIEPGNTAWVFYVLLIPFFIVTLITSMILFLIVEKPYSFGKTSLTNQHPNTKEIKEVLLK